MKSSDQAFSSTYDELQEIWEAAGDYTPNVTFDSATAYDKFAAKYEIPTDYTKSSSNFKRVLLSLAIAALLLSSSLFVYFNFVKSDSLSNDSNKVEIFAHNNDNLTLSPGAAIAFNDDGSVEDIQGNVYFDKNEKFSLELKDETLTAEGASFNLSKSSGSDELRLDVKEGTVKLVDQNGETDVFTSEKSMVYNLSSGLVNSFDASSSNNYLMWTSNKLSFNKTNIVDVFQEMESFFGVTINVDGDVPTNCHFTAPIIKNAAVSSVFELLNSAFDFSVIKTGEGVFEVSSVSCK